MVHVITIAEWLNMFDDSEMNILSQHVGTYVAISYITHEVLPPEQRVPFPFAGVSVTPRGHEGDVIRTGLEYLAACGIKKVWIDVFSAPEEADMGRVERTYRSASIVYGLLNRNDSRHLRQVLYAIRGLKQTISLPQPGLPPEYLQLEPCRISPASSDYYMSEHTFWTRIWPFAELAVAKSFSYVIQNGAGATMSLRWIKSSATSMFRRFLSMCGTQTRCSWRSSMGSSGETLVLRVFMLGGLRSGRLRP
jgi:hypothetical protein